MIFLTRIILMYYIGDNGVYATGFIDIDWYWFKSDGSMAVSETVKIGGKSYKFDDKGICLIRDHLLIDCPKRQL